MLIGKKDVESFINSLKDKRCGAVVLFLGTVRDDGQDILRVEAYNEMAENEMQKIIEDAKNLGAVKADIVHALGDLNVGDHIVLIGASAPHREEAFTACRYMIEELKKRVPIWKVSK